jgi:glycosyltransferase involved in cell wall biosynthesis
MPESATSVKPLLTLAVPTFNRAEDLHRFLTAIEPQMRDRPEVDLYLSDNASTDGTPELIAHFQARGLALRSHRHPQNIGADANFVSCFHAARGTYFWLCGDDELILPGGLDLILSHLRSTDSDTALDILYLSSFSFRSDYLAERQHDRMGRQHHTFTNVLRFTRLIHINFTFISGVITHRDRLLALPHEAPDAFLGTNLVQLSWTLPLLRAHRRSRILWTRVIASRWNNSGGYSLARVFGKNLSEVTRRLLPDRPELSAAILNAAIGAWFPVTILGIREDRNASMQLEETHTVLQPLFGTNPRYWLFTYPALRLSLPAARLWVRLTHRLLTLAGHARNPGFWRRST